MINLIAVLIDAFSGRALNAVASTLGESQARTQAALSSAVPALVTGLSHAASTPEQATKMLELLKSNRFDVGYFTDPAITLGAPGGITQLMATGRTLMELVFGRKARGLANWVASSSGLERAASSSLLGLALPLVLGQIGKHLGATEWSATNLMTVLQGQNQFLPNAPPGLATVLTAVGGTDAVGIRDSDVDPLVGTAEPTQSRGWLWALPLLAFLVLFSLFLFRRHESPRDAASPLITASPSPVGTSTEPRRLPTSGLMVERRLPNRASIRIPSQGMENQLLSYIEGTSQVSSNERWFSFDRLEFDVDSAHLTAASSEQVRNIAEILRAYPHVHVKIGGYTDNTGDAASNLALSRERAIAAMQALADRGVERSRLEAEGYGQNHPVADNTTPEGRQRNRRVDIRVTQK